MKNRLVVPVILFLVALVGATGLLVAAGLAEPARVQVSAASPR